MLTRAKRLLLVVEVALVLALGLSIIFGNSSIAVRAPFASRGV